MYYLIKLDVYNINVHTTEPQASESLPVAIVTLVPTK